MPTQIYHITHFENLERILVAGGLGAVTWLRGHSATYTNIAHANIQDRRAGTWVPAGPGGTLHDYVPFYFAPRSPMLYAIDRGAVQGHTEGQRPILHLVSSAEAVRNAAVPFVFTDGHAIMMVSNFYDDLAHLNRIDWGVMASRYWNDTLTDGDRCRRRQAEFLVKDFFPWLLVEEIGVIDAVLQARVQAALHGAAHTPVVSVRPAWYY